MDGPTRPRRVLVVVLLIAITFVSLDLRGFGPLDRVARGVREATEPLRSGVNAITEPIGRAWGRLFNYDDLVTENRELRQRLAAAEGQALTSRIDAALVNRLRAAGVEFIDDYPLVIARVERGASGNFESFHVELNKGEDAGLRNGMAVIDGAGMVGRLERVDADRATVVLITDLEFRVGVRLSESNITALIRGIGSANEVELVITGSLDDVVDGEVVATAGPDSGSLYPPDIPIGVVRFVGVGENRRAVVDLAASMDALDFVSVVIYQGPDPIDEILGDREIVVPTTTSTTTTSSLPPSSTTSTTTTTPPAVPSSGGAPDPSESVGVDG